MIEQIPPGMLLVLGALLLPLLPRAVRPALSVALPLLGLLQVWMLSPGMEFTVPAFGYELELLRVDRLSKIFGIIFHIAALLSVIYALHVKDLVQQVCGLAYAGCAIGAVFAGDLISLFLFWEGTAITSVFLIWARRTERSYKTGMRYLVVQVLSGVLLLAGALVHYAETGSLAFGRAWTSTAGEEALRGAVAFETLADASPAALLILLAFGIKAAFPFLHSWLQDAYPESTPTGTVWLSAFTTKLAIYALIRGFAGTEILIPIGAAMTAFPIFYAVIENDLRKVLAYSLNNQLGYMVVGVGIGSELAINGAAGHAFAHIIYKGLLFMSMGAVLHRVGTIKGSELGGLWRSMPWTTVFCCIGAASISAFPLFSGFVTKSMILAAAAEEHMTVTFLILLFASAGVFHHSGIKIPYFAFFAHDSGRRPAEAPANMLVAMAAAAALCIGIGCWPGPLYAMLPFEVQSFVPYDMTHVVTQSQLLFYSALAFVFLQKFGLYPPELASTNIDSEWIYRKGGRKLVLACWGACASVGTALRAFVDRTIRRDLWLIREVHKPHHGPLGEPWPIGEAALWAAGLLAAFALLALA
ncbi:MAG: Na(+)/H(+) antiporter subunit D [Myxococcota bacterium]|nr:Na(+)/H(+) antiporter subunit D [Myxococcota bacterium]